MLHDEADSIEVDAELETIGVDALAVDALDAEGYAAAIPGLAALIVDAVAGGASVNFLAGVSVDDAAAWWSARLPDVRDGTTTAFVARNPATGAIVGSTLLIRSRNENSPHRAEIGKVLVHRSARRRGLGRALMAAAEDRAISDGRWLLILDTQAGSDADAFYRALGWRELGTMPNHAYRSDGVLAPTTYFWKDLRPA
ncbi:MAG: GNAT family N-acetyltransferase [Chloroflexi bacterium]|nr:GNAT family N-acetyltransferase [Chloroflexota bacterium]